MCLFVVFYYRFVREVVDVVKYTVVVKNDCIIVVYDDFDV